MFKLNGSPINIHADLVIGNGDGAITIPSGSLQDPATRAQYGITEHPDPPRPDDRFYWVTDNGDESFSAVQKDIDGLRQTALAQIKTRRQSALDCFSKSSGISAAYDENIKAAQATKAGAGATTIMRDNSTAEDYLAKMAVGMGVTVEQFADYVIAENSVAASKASEIEAEYVRLAYQFIPRCTFEQVKVVDSEYQAFCQARMI